MLYGPFTREFERWYDPASFPAALAGNVTGVGLLRQALPTRTYKVDSVGIFTADVAQPVPAAASFTKALNTLLSATDYTFDAGRTIEMQGIGASIFLAALPAATQLDGAMTPRQFGQAVLDVALAMAMENLLVTGSGVAPATLGLNAAGFPKTTLAAAVATVQARLRSLMALTRSIRSGAGETRASILTGHPLVLEQLFDDVLNYGSGNMLVEEDMRIPNTDHPTWGVRLPNVAAIPVVPSSFWPVGGGVGSLTLIDTSGNGGVHIAVPEQRPGVVHQDDDIPGGNGGLLAATLEFNLMGLDDTKVAQLTGYPTATW